MITGQVHCLAKLHSVSCHIKLMSVRPAMVWFGLVGLLLFNGIFSTNRLYRAIRDEIT